MKTSGIIIGYLSILALCAVLQIIWQPDGFRWEFSENEWLIVTQIRLPRLLMAFSAGMVLALCGFIMQWLVQNPMADPYLLGTSGGASLGHVLLMFTGVRGYWLSLLGAFVFSSGASFTAFRIATFKNQLSLFRLLLAGLAISSFCVAISSAVILWMEGDQALRNYMLWNFGSLDNAHWWSAFAVLAGGVFLVFFLHRTYASLLLFSMGVERASNLGMPIRSLRKQLLIITSLCVALVVTLAGPIGFVGLIVPHVVKQFLKISSSHFVVFLALSGGVFLCVCDTIASLLFSHAFPVGLITSFVGIPLFIYLLSKRGNYQ